MPFTIQDILDNASLRTRLLGGNQGAGRRLRWAHVCELADPTEWLGDGDLLMTTGIAIPSDAQAQRDYLQRLATARVAGLMIGENMQAPTDIQALQDEAMRLGFPLLMTHYAVPFSAVTRAIVDASKQEEHERRSAVTRIYESARIGLRGLGLADLLRRLSSDVRAQLFLFDSATLQPWQEGLPALPERWRQSLAQRRAVPETVTRTSNGEQEALVMPLPSLATCEILATGGELIDYGLLHHVVAVLGIELERAQVEHERMLRLGSELLDDLLQQRLTERAAQERLGQLHCRLDTACVVLARGASGLPEHWQQRLQRLGAGLLVRNQGDELIVLLSDPARTPSLQAALDCPLGRSNPLGHGLRATEALREARLALAHATHQRPLVAYADAQGEQSWLPASLEEAQRVHRRVLGALADYDTQQGGQLQHTLRVFLEQNRSWQKAAQLLNVHKQTLVYRIRRIEEITERSLDSTDDVAVLWIALRSAQIAGIDAGVRE
ncbi:PucR family transcriptional regulator ligand-binding domain-containing protein [Pseudomonas sp. PDNC002]|uniref:PucR family transcriptional regulator n=1 Tax=Pseudomonas sp. PDNC002 TaxID=2811422 RepID=UPI001964FA44|nr:PucR family transcriptional regulator [Pseudomonas sp. PDNC002]QRY77848.1 PucR family transcriptional regulator ligand-binding domain-containing protein [Pseudomonas sp. PDNC002]